MKLALENVFCIIVLCCLGLHKHDKINRHIGDLAVLVDLALIRDNGANLHFSINIIATKLHFSNKSAKLITEKVSIIMIEITFLVHFSQS